MLNKRTIWTVVLSVCAGTAVYVLYIKNERASSINKFAASPQRGDVYKMQKDTRKDGLTVFYLKVKDIGAQSIYFYPSRLVLGNLHDSFLKDFDTSRTEVYTKVELAEIAAGKWMVPAKDDTQLIEIERNR